MARENIIIIIIFGVIFSSVSPPPPPLAHHLAHFLLLFAFAATPTRRYLFPTWDWTVLIVVFFSSLFQVGASCRRCGGGGCTWLW